MSYFSNNANDGNPKAHFHSNTNSSLEDYFSFVPNESQCVTFKFRAALLLQGWMQQVCSGVTVLRSDVVTAATLMPVSGGKVKIAVSII